MRRGPAVLAATALALAACGADDDPATTEPTPAPAPDPPDEPIEPDDDADEPDVEAMAFIDCEAERYTIGYPEGWHTNDPADGLLGACEAFHPDPIDEPEQPRDRDLHHAVSVYIDPVDLDELRGGDPLHEVIEEREVTIDGRDALVTEIEATDDALLPEGERRYGYAIDLDGEVLVVSTHTVGDTDHERDVRILDRMVSEELTITGESDGDVDGPEPVAGPATTDETVRDNEGTMLVVTDVRVGGHEGFDRVTFEIEGDDAPPGWRIAYDDEPRSAGSGQEVEIAGEAVLHVSLTSFAYPFDAPVEPRDGPERIDAAGTSAIAEVLDDSIYEGHHDWWIGLDEQRPYRVELLEDPTRLVIDLVTD